MNITILVEGVSESNFVKNVLAPFFLQKQIYVKSTILATKRVKGGKDFKGGVLNYEKTKKELLKLLYQTDGLVTTMFDFYALPDSFPGKTNSEFLDLTSGLSRVQYLEQKLLDDINHQRFMPYLQLHEFEALVLADFEPWYDWFDENNEDSLAEISKLISNYPNPEDINEGKETAPSKRIGKLLPEYRKTLHGDIITEQIGIQKLLEKCPHFNTWINNLL